MQIILEENFLKNYPDAEIGYLVANVSVKKSNPFVDHLKKTLAEYIQRKGMNATNFTAHPSLSIWRKIYRDDFQVKETTYRSSVEALLRRIVTGKGLWNILNIVDLYNCCSVLSLLPMGGYDTRKISGDIRIRYAKEGEIFQGIGEKQTITAKSHHVVYADDQKLLCWLWNHKDALKSCIDETTTQVIFFIDSAVTNTAAIRDTITVLSSLLEKIECIPLQSGILNRHSSSVTQVLPCFR